MLAVMEFKFSFCVDGCKGSPYVEHERREADTEFGRHHCQASLFPPILGIESVHLFSAAIVVATLFDLLPECKHVPVLQSLAEVSLVSFFVHVEFTQLFDGFAEFAGDHGHDRLIEENSLDEPMSFAAISSFRNIPGAHRNL